MSTGLPGGDADRKAPAGESRAPKGGVSVTYRGSDPEVVAIFRGKPYRFEAGKPATVPAAMAQGAPAKPRGKDQPHDVARLGLTSRAAFGGGS